MKRPEVVVVTGASAGLGRAIVRRFAERGASLGLIARGVDGLEAARREVEEAGGEAVVCPLDVADPLAVESAAEHIESVLGPIDIWINDAMVSVFSPAREMTPDEYRRVTEVTYLGYVYGTLSALRRMLPRDRGLIIQVGSALAYRGIPLQSAYCGAKHAIQGFTESVRSELMHDRSRVRITMVQMPALNTPQFGWVKSRLERKAQPVPPIFQPEVGAEAVAWVADHYRRELFVGWPTVKAIYGNMVAPGFADWYLSRTCYEAQQTDEPRDPEAPNNLWTALPGDHGAHGTFDARALPHSTQLWADERRGRLLAGGLALGAAALAAWGLARRAGKGSGGPQGERRPASGWMSSQAFVSHGQEKLHEESTGHV